MMKNNFYEKNEKSDGDVDRWIGQMMPKCHTTQVACNENKNENDVGNHLPKKGNLKCSRSQARQNGVKKFCCRNREKYKK